MTKPSLSIVVPVYNTEKYLRRCMDSIMNQTLKDIEIIIVDDGSKEGCAVLCDEISKTDSRIKVVHKENGGLGFARNSGIEEATGEYIGFVDSDDYIEPIMCETLYNAAKKYNADLAISGICFVGGNMFSRSGGDTKKSYFEEETVFEKEDTKKLLLGVVGALPHEPDDSRYGVSVCKNIFKTSVIRERKIEFLSERKILSEDTLFMVDFIKSSQSAVGVPGAYYCYCRNEDSLSKSYNKERFEKSIVFLDELEKRIADTIGKEKYKSYLDRLTQGFGRILCSQEIMNARDKKIKFFVLRKRLKEICTQDKIQDVLKSYPWYRLPVKQAAFAFAMKYKLFLLQKLMVILRDR
ncbi:MAG: glycosyltransferase family 2 protein [Clostridia bacterium]|nr:glycosyltransferase family 2 protein [Clostridia bacterium]